MYLLETAININSVWVVNLLTGAVGFWILKMLLEKFIKAYDTRLTAAEHEAEEIKKNYNKKFDEVHEKIDETKEVIIERIDALNKDKMEWRMQQTKDMATLQSDLRHLTDTIKTSNNGRDSRGGENRDGDRQNSSKP